MKTYTLASCHSGQKPFLPFCCRSIHPWKAETRTHQYPVFPAGTAPLPTFDKHSTRLTCCDKNFSNNDQTP